MSDTALLLIDVQVGLLAEEEWPIYEGDALVERLAALVTRAREANIPVIFVQHCASNEADPLHPSLPGNAIDPRVAPRPGELVVQKTHPDSFQETTLQSALEKRGIKHLIVGGMETGMCVDTTTRRASGLGYKVTLVADGHSTPKFGEITAAQVIAHHNMVLGMGFAEVVPAAEIEFTPEAAG